MCGGTQELKRPENWSLPDCDVQHGYNVNKQGKRGLAKKKNDTKFVSWIQTHCYFLRAAKARSEFVGLYTWRAVRAGKWKGATALPPRSEINIQQ